MNQSQFIITRTSFAKAILLGHTVNIIVALVVFLVSHYLLEHPTVVSVIITLIGTIIGAIISSAIGTKKLTAPVHTLSQELHLLHEKVNTSTTALSRLSNESRAFSDALPVGIITLNAKDQLTHINSKAIHQIGLGVETNDEEKIKTRDVFDRLSAIEALQKDTDSLEEWIHQAKTQKIQDSKLWPFVVTQDPLDNTIAYDMLVSYNKGDVFGYELIIILVDRTDEYIKQGRQMEFISLAAHELRGPITVLRGLVDVFREELDDQISEDHKELLRRMRVSSRQLAGYVDNILNVSHIEKEEFSVRPTQVNWSDILTQALSELTLRAQSHQRNIEVHIPKNLPPVAADASAMSHVINNLVDNAIKYSKPGGTVRINVEKKEDTIETTIQDFGIGIPANVIDHLFTKFYRSHKSKGAINGTGLGLYLCKAMVSAHGGNIWVRSSEGKGATFGFTIPIYSSVADKLKNNNNKSSGIVRSSHGWIKNHNLYRR